MTARAEPYQNEPAELSPTMAAALALLTDSELAAMTRRAYYGAAAAWRDLRAWSPVALMTPDDYRTVRAMLAQDAESLDDWHNTLRTEARRRAPAVSAE